MSQAPLKSDMPVLSDSGGPAAPRESDRLPVRLGVLAAGPPDDVRTWSGVPFSMTRALGERLDSLTFFEATPVGSRRHRYERARRAAARTVGRESLPHLDPRELRRRCLSVERQMERADIDALLAITVDQLAAFVDTDLPIIHHSDTTFAGLEGFYEQYSNLTRASSRNGHDIAQRVVERAALLTYPSTWAARSAVEHYGADPERVHVVPYGANLENPPPVEEALDVTARDRCRLLFIGREWERKGGPLVWETVAELRRRGVDASLTVVGTDPGLDPDHVEVHSFLNKQIPEQAAIYDDVWRRSAFLFMPTRADTFGAVYCEAAAKGIPAIATDTGGVADAVADGVSGRVLPLSAQADAYADVIEAAWGDRAAYLDLVSGSRRRFESDLNWDVWGDRTAALIGELLDCGGHSPE